MPLLKHNEHYTYSDYCTWDDGKRWELIDGIPYLMSPAPSPIHQQISVKLAWQLQNFLNEKPCKLFTAPFDVRLNADDEDDIVVQPDLVVICDNAKIDDKGCKGAPDLAIEILSPSTARTDRVLKFQRYQRARVQEYWIVDPETKSVQVCTLNEHGQYVALAYADTDIVPVEVLPGCVINLQEIFVQDNQSNENDNN